MGFYKNKTSQTVAKKQRWIIKVLVELVSNGVPKTWNILVNKHDTRVVCIEIFVVWNIWKHKKFLTLGF